MALDTLDEEETAQDPEISGAISAVLTGMQTVTPEGKAQAARVFQDLYGARGAADAEQDALYDEYEQRAQEARVILRRAREQLAARRAPNNKWLDMAAGYGSPTRSGRFGESMGNYAKLRRDSVEGERAWEEDRVKQMLAYEQGENNIDQTLALQKLKLRQAQRAANDRLMLESMKIMGKPSPGAGKLTPKQKTMAKMDEKFTEDYLQWVQGAGADAAKSIAELQNARDTLRSGKSDTISGPAVGILPKVVRDIFLPKSSEIQEDVESTVQRSLKLILGSQFTEKEGERFLSRVYNTRFDEKQLANRVERLLFQIQTAYNEKVRMMQYFEDNQTLEGYKGKKHWSLGEFEDSFFKDVTPQGSVLARAEAEADAALGNTPAPQAQPPAQATGPKLGSKERARYKMPDGKWFNVPQGMTEEQARAVYAKKTGQKFAAGGAVAPEEEEVYLEDFVPAGEEGQFMQEFASPAAPAEAEAEVVLDEAAADAAAPAEAGPSATELALHGAAGAAGGAAADRLLPAVRDRFLPARAGGLSPAQRRLTRLMTEVNRSPADIVGGARNSARMGIPGMVLDDAAMRPLAQAALSSSGTTNATETLQRLRARQSGIIDRAEDQVNKGLAPSPYFDEQKKLTDALYSNSDPLYKAAYAANPTVQSKVLFQILDTPAGKKAVKQALTLMRNQPGKKIGKVDALGMLRSPSLEFLDHVKRGFDDLIIKEEGSGPTRKATAMGKTMRDLRNKLRDELDTATVVKGKSLYKDARMQYAGDLEVLDALEMGREKFASLRPEELQTAVKNMSWAEKDALRTGAAQKLFEQLQDMNSLGDANAAKKMIGTESNRRKLRALFDNDKQYRLFEAALMRDAELFDESKRLISAGESGQVAQALKKDVGPIRKFIGKYVPKLGIGSSSMWALQAARHMGDVSDKELDEIMGYMKSSNPDELASFEKTFGPRFKRAKSRTKGRTALVAGAAGAAAAGAHALGVDDE